MTCCYTDANGSSCHCQRRKDAEAALATARADALREAAGAINPPAHCTAAHGQYWQGVHAARAAILALIPQEPKP